jgi:hypothetical protein
MCVKNVVISDTDNFIAIIIIAIIIMPISVYV